MSSTNRTPLEYVRDHLKQASILHLATCSDNLPWIATCRYACDEDLNLYFVSKQSRRHSGELRSNPNVACAIVKPEDEAEGKKKLQGLQIQGIADELSGTALIHGCSAYLGRWVKLRQHLTLESLQRAGGARLYRVRPTLIVLLDEVNFPEEPRQEIVVPIHR